MRDQQPPRDPEAYRETNHFDDCFEDPMRFIERPMVDDIIEEGRDYPTEGGRGKLRRKLDVGGVDAVLVIAKDEPVLITGWTEVRSYETAMASGEWTHEQLQTISSFQAKEHKGGRNYA